MNTKENLLLSEANNIHLRSTSFQDETILNRTTEENDTINLLNFDPRIKAHTFLTR